MAKLLFQGHGSYRITADDRVIYVDPYAGEGYVPLADIILVTHEHNDHNRVDIVPKKETCRIIRSSDALVKGVYKSFDVDGINIAAVPAYNSNHNRKKCVGYIITVGGIKIYAAGDTSITDAMSDFPALKIDYALLPIDGIYNMDPFEASFAAGVIGANHVIPIHMKPGALFDEEMANKFTAGNRLIMKANEEIDLSN